MDKRKMEKLEHDLIAIHGPQNLNSINTSLRQIKPGTLSGLDEPGYRNYVQGISNNIKNQMAGRQSPRGLAQQDAVSQMGRSQMSNSPGKRHLPVAAKQMIYNEWAAIINHQDEQHKVNLRNDAMQLKDQQSRYRHDLEEQKENLVRQALQQRMREAQQDNDIMKFQKAQAELRLREEQARIGNKRDKYIVDQKQSIKDAEKTRAQREQDRLIMQDMERNQNQA
jgi:hypothetical protein